MAASAPMFPRPSTAEPSVTGKRYAGLRPA